MAFRPTLHRSLAGGGHPRERGTQAGAVAENAGVSAGTIYLYVTDKASLFDLVVRRALHDPESADVAIPYGVDRPERLVDDLRDRFRPRTNEDAEARSGLFAHAWIGGLVARDQAHVERGATGS